VFDLATVILNISCDSIQMTHGGGWTLKYDETEVENVARGPTVLKFVKFMNFTNFLKLVKFISAHLY